ncbi:hypothetical protein DRQ53_11780 [bacterium]|nr:MAG: hypothetical protein DRQ53_11780 [bacterium]
MTRSILVLLTLALAGAWATGCSDSGPSAPGGGTANRAPGIPTIDTGAGAPDDGSTDQVLSSTLHWQCSDPDGDDLTFDVFFGTDANPPSANSGQSVESYDPGALAFSTTYFWKIVAEDPDGETSTSSVWSFTTLAPGSETVSTPTAPTGPATGSTGESLDFSTGGSTNSAGHSVQYRFDWGDGSYADWSASVTHSNSWASAGTNNVKAQARCATHTNIESAWSAGHDVVISAVTETVSTPDTPTGPATADTSENPRFDTSGGTSSEGHNVDYRFDWGADGISDWGSSTYRHNRFDTPGNYDVKAQARCRDHTGVESAWSDAHSIEITAAAEVIHRSVGSVNGPTNAGVGELLSYTLSTAASSSLDHDLEYQFNWRDGSFSDWSATRDASHTWTVAGDYYVTVVARCAVHTSIVSDDSPSTHIAITDAAETVSAPSRTRGETSKVSIDIEVWFDAAGAVSSYGHDCEYRFDFADGTFSEWVGPNVRTLHAWADYGVYDIRAQGRCIEHPEAVSEWTTDIHRIWIRESITVPTKPTGPGSGLVGETLTYNTGGSVSTDGHDLEYAITMYLSGQTTYSEYSATGEIQVVFDGPGQYQVRARTRCITHPDVRSNTSDFIWVTISAP